MFAEWFVHTKDGQANGAELSRHALASSCESGLADLKAGGVKFKGFVGESVADMETKRTRECTKKNVH